MYLPPDGNINNFLDLIDNKLTDIYETGYPDVVIMGDVNIDFQTTSSFLSKYQNLLQNDRLDQIITEYTRTTPRSKTLIDHALVNRAEMYHICGTLELDMSDHMLIYVSRKKLELPRSRIKTYTGSYREYNKHMYYLDTCQLNGTWVLDASKVDTAIENFLNLLMPVIDYQVTFKDIQCKEKSAEWKVMIH